MYKGTKAEDSYYLSETTSPLVAVTVEKKPLVNNSGGDKMTGKTNPKEPPPCGHWQYVF